MMNVECRSEDTESHDFQGRTRLRAFRTSTFKIRHSTFSSSKFERIAFVFTPKELCHIAQGCSRSELPWVERNVFIVTLKGLRHASSMPNLELLKFGNCSPKSTSNPASIMTNGPGANRRQPHESSWKR